MDQNKQAQGYRNYWRQTNATNASRGKPTVCKATPESERRRRVLEEAKQEISGNSLKPDVKEVWDE